MSQSPGGSPGTGGLALCGGRRSAGPDFLVYLLSVGPATKQKRNEVKQVTFGKGVWHVHGGAWSPDGRWMVYTRDFDRGNLSVIDNYR